MMNFISGHSQQAFFMLHGGAGPMDPSSSALRLATESLLRIMKQTLTKHLKDPMEQIVSCLEGMEDDEIFNAGYGAALQADGKPRLTAAVMNGLRQSFSGVISLTDVRHPSRLALALQDARARVLTAPGHELMARKLQLPVENLITKRRLEFWQKQIREALFETDTVGALYWDGQDGLFAGTSTGGRGFEEPGRVSDSATVAGTYASRAAAVSTTGIGEEIVDDALAVRIETRVRDGMSLVEACRRTYTEAETAQRSYGWIACDQQGHWCVAYTTLAMSYLVIDQNTQILAASYIPKM